jgi:osmotically-inducible protein OsmY
MSVTTERSIGLEASLDIEEQARIRLQHSPYRAIRRVSCRFEDGVLTLVGRVPTFHYKQLAQTAVVQIPGISRVVNEIDVDGSP